MNKTYLGLLSLALSFFWGANAWATDYNLSQVQTHNSASDCWTIIGSNVYNLSSYIASHPGGVGPISSICGVNGSTAFTTKHGSQTSAQTALATLLIGNYVVADNSAPSTPINLKTQAMSSNQINLAWDAATDNVAVTGYKIFRDAVLLGTTASTFYSNTGLSANTSYNYNVLAFDALGNESTLSATSGTTTLASSTETIIPSTPTNLTAVATLSTAIKLTWTVATDNIGVVGYNIYRNSVLIGTSLTNKYTDSGLKADTAYSFSVVAFDAAGNYSLASNTATAKTLIKDPATTPKFKCGKLNKSKAYRECKRDYDKKYRAFRKYEDERIREQRKHEAEDLREAKKRAAEKLREQKKQSDEKLKAQRELEREAFKDASKDIKAEYKEAKQKNSPANNNARFKRDNSNERDEDDD